MPSIDRLHFIHDLTLCRRKHNVMGTSILAQQCQPNRCAAAILPIEFDTRTHAPPADVDDAAKIKAIAFACGFAHGLAGNRGLLRSLGRALGCATGSNCLRLLQA